MSDYEALSTEARELVLFTENQRSLYPQFLEIVHSLQRKIKAGKYDPALAPKLWKYWYDAGSKEYKKEFGYAFDVSARKEAAEYEAAFIYDEIMLGNYD
jgi:hypothetical protein